MGGDAPNYYNIIDFVIIATQEMQKILVIQNLEKQNEFSILYHQIVIGGL